MVGLLLTLESEELLLGVVERLLLYPVILVPRCTTYAEARSR